MKSIKFFKNLDYLIIFINLLIFMDHFILPLVIYLHQIIIMSFMFFILMFKLMFKKSYFKMVISNLNVKIHINNYMIMV